MKRPGAYVVSVILSVFLVFGLLGSAAAVIADIQLNPKACTELAVRNDIPHKVYTELEKYYTDKYNSSGIPASVYMDAIDEAYLKTVVDSCITAGFESLDSGGSFVNAIPKNQALEDSIDKFFNDYADEIGYEKDSAFEKKLSVTKSSAYTLIGSYCDAYKFSAMSSHGVLSKLSKLYRHRGLLTADIIGVTLIVLLLIMLVNFRELRTVLYWSGISCIVGAVLGIVPCLYLIAAKYFNSFTIKQPQVFTVYTQTLYRLTGAMLAAMIATLIVGIALLVVYAVSGTRRDVAPTDISGNDGKSAENH